jgi:hypothetical protein
LAGKTVNCTANARAKVANGKYIPCSRGQMTSYRRFRFTGPQRDNANLRHNRHHAILRSAIELQNLQVRHDQKGPVHAATTTSACASRRTDTSTASRCCPTASGGSKPVNRATASCKVANRIAHCPAIAHRSSTHRTPGSVCPTGSYAGGSTVRRRADAGQRPAWRDAGVYSPSAHAQRPRRSPAGQVRHRAARAGTPYDAR